MTERIRSDSPAVETIRATVTRSGGTRRPEVRLPPDSAAAVPDGTDHLAAWIDDRGIDFGRSVLLDVVVPGEQFGLRAPGEEVVYEVRRGPASDLQDIARDLE